MLLQLVPVCMHLEWLQAAHGPCWKNSFGIEHAPAHTVWGCRWTPSHIYTSINTSTAHGGFKSR